MSQLRENFIHKSNRRRERIGMNVMGQVATNVAYRLSGNSARRQMLEVHSSTKLKLKLCQACGIPGEGSGRGW